MEGCLSGVENGGKCWKVEDRYLVELLVCMTYLLYRFVKGKVVENRGK